MSIASFHKHDSSPVLQADLLADQLFSTEQCAFSHLLVNTNEEDELPSVILTSRSAIAGMSPKALIEAHRAILRSKNSGKAVDMHSVTLSRFHIEPEVTQRAEIDANEMADMNAFQLGDPTSEVEIQ